MVLVGVGGSAAGLLVQRLVVPQAHGVDAEQLGRRLADPLVERERGDVGRSSQRFMHWRNDCW